MSCNQQRIQCLIGVPADSNSANISIMYSCIKIKINYFKGVRKLSNASWFYQENYSYYSIPQFTNVMLEMPILPMDRVLNAQ